MLTFASLSSFKLTDKWFTKLLGRIARRLSLMIRQKTGKTVDVKLTAEDYRKSLPINNVFTIRIKSCKKKHLISGVSLALIQFLSSYMKPSKRPNLAQVGKYNVCLFLNESRNNNGLI